MVDDSGLNRREYLITVGSAGAAALTGCSTDDGGTNSTPEENDNGTMPDSTPTGTETGTPTETETPEPLQVDWDISDSAEIYDRILLGTETQETEEDMQYIGLNIQNGELEDLDLNLYTPQQEEPQEVQTGEPIRLEQLGEHTLEAVQENKNVLAEDSFQVTPVQLDNETNNQRILEALSYMPKEALAEFYDVTGLEQVGTEEAFEEGPRRYNNERNKSVNWHVDAVNNGSLRFDNLGDLEQDDFNEILGVDSISINEEYKGFNIIDRGNPYPAFIDEERGVLVYGTEEALKSSIDTITGDNESLAEALSFVLNSPVVNENPVLSMGVGIDTDNSLYGQYDVNTTTDKPFYGRGILTIDYDTTYHPQESSREDLFMEQVYRILENRELENAAKPVGRPMEAVVGDTMNYWG